MRAGIAAHRGTRLGTGICVAIATAASPGAVAAPAAADDGGAFAAPRPAIAAVRCATGCVAPAAVHPGGTVSVRGSLVDGRVTVVFLGRSGAGDDAGAAARGRRGVVTVRVPAGARSGPLRVIGTGGVPSLPSRTSIVVDRSTPLTSRSGVSAQLSATRVTYAGPRRATVDYVLRTRARQDVRVSLVRLADGREIASWVARSVEPGTPRSVAWAGTAGGRVQSAGRYQFRIAVGPQPRAGESATGHEPRESAVGSFTFLPWMFPIRGPHGYGGGAGRFGAGRAGHSHQGQDVFARCGTPLVAARGGRVRYRAYQGAAGNYLVIDGAGTSFDYAYMHLRSPALVRTGQRVYTGQLVGYVGDTGDAVGCHLHFELWTAPGWYRGGSPVDPLSTLRAWDRYS